MTVFGARLRVGAWSMHRVDGWVLRDDIGAVVRINSRTVAYNPQLSAIVCQIIDSRRG